MKKLGEILIEHGLVTPFHVDRAVWWQHDDGGRIGGLLIRLGYLEESGFLRVMAPLVHAAPIRLDDGHLDPRALGRVPARIARSTSAIAVAVENDRLVVAMADPGNLTAISDLEAVTGMRVETRLAADPAVARALDRFYPIETTLPVLATPGAQGGQGGAVAVVSEPTADTGHALDRLLVSWIQDGLVGGARTLVIERSPHFLVVRCEMPNESFELTQLQVLFHRPLVSRLRVAAGLPTPSTRGWRQVAPIAVPFRGAELRVELTLFPDTFGPTARIALDGARTRLLDSGLLPASAASSAAA
ncbi:MAG: hypothetical protein IPK07_17835 [Deltaproteobacteria bacterium]|nr:hypothetical protein [Deltaproteobacteria bacterium]